MTGKKTATDVEPLGPALCLASGTLAHLAQAAVTRSSVDAAEALVAVVFSVAAVDAFCAEAVGVCWSLYPGDKPPVAGEVLYELAALGRPIKKGKRKGQVPDIDARHLRRVIAGKPPNPELPVWLNHFALCELRNEIAHLQPRRYARRGEAHEQRLRPALRRLAEVGVIRRGPGEKADAQFSQLAHVENAEVAVWAYETERAVLVDLVDRMPEGGLREMLWVRSAWARPAEENPPNMSRRSAVFVEFTKKS